MRKILAFSVIFVLLSCTSTYVEHIITSEGATLELNGARFEIPENSVRDSTQIRIEKKGVAKKNYEQGYRIKGESFVISPERLIFEKPLKFSLPVKDSNAALGAKIGSGFVPLASSVVEGETLRAQLRHGGEYYLISKPAAYGIRDHSDTEEGLLIISDIYVSDYIKNFKKVLRQGGYDFPIWTFVYPNDKSIEENAKFLADELKILHEQYGNFRLDIVSFGIGGLITHRYIADTMTYQRDISPAVIAVGTPFFGSNFVSIDSIRKGESPFRFFFLDGLGENVKDLDPKSEFISWTKKKKLVGYQHDDLEENKNFASIRGEFEFDGVFPEEYEGDGLVSLFSTMLTPLEPEPFSQSHFNLFEDSYVHEVIGDFVQLYRTFNWPMLFDKVWKEKSPYSKILEIWEKEKRLHYRDINFDILLEWNENMLKSVPENAILITNGDNDTYPAWYLQEKGVRQDVLIVNRSLFNLKEYVLFLQRKGLSLEITEKELDEIKFKKENDDVITKSDQLIKLLVKQDKRPVVFSTTVRRPERYGYPLMLVGVIYEIGEGDIEIGGKFINVAKTQELFHQVYSYEKLHSVPYDSLSQDIQAIWSNHAAALHSLTYALYKQEKFEEALKEAQFAQQLAQRRFRYMFHYFEADIYLKKNELEKADNLFKKILEAPDLDVGVKKNIAKKYYDDLNMKEEAIRILAECLKENPNDREIPELIKQYQEGL
jgi:tetratricopeptide (TPR) repeat protein